MLADLDGRPLAALRLAAYSEAIYAQRGEARERNETAATQRALALARAALGDGDFARAQLDAAGLRDADVAEVAFGSG